MPEIAVDHPAVIDDKVANRRSPDYELVPFARFFDDNPYELLAPPEEMPDQSTLKEPRP
ncbi:hypothetical protein FTUN_0730 [Frigoriglobus tundricola]|uniref:Uncharacterized protein n=1 Tax=Frigoriglobus tundricola TaxID=2774151 RepID=A0A6M5YGS1_9BACT|nr:hypothetical protein FTUN_0730 [Frigoriglobus tundricola]